MKNLPLLFLGIFATLAFSWTGIVLVNQIGYGKIQPHYDEAEDAFFPGAPTGVAMRGKEVYRELGCIYCHSQQVRHDLVFGKGEDNPDIARGWGARGSVARDYLYEKRVDLGTMRTGPDLRNVGRRYDANWNHLHLYYPPITSPGSIMPSYTFLYEMRKIVGEPSPRALKINAEAAKAAGVPSFLIPKEGYEVVPTQRADDLVAYLLSLNDLYEYPEVKAPGSVKLKP
jgi:cytochrome c oxidase cbb3-type subunit II